MNPSPYYAQHFKLAEPRIDERAFRPYWRIQRKSRLDRLLDEGAISPFVWCAAVRFRDAAQQFIGGVRSYERMPRGSMADRAIYRFQARALVQRVRAELGVVATALIWSCAVDDSSWAAVGARLRVHPKTARRWTIAALEALASIKQRR